MTIDDERKKDGQEMEMRARGKSAAWATIDAAGNNPYDCKGSLLAPTEPTAQYVEAEKQDMDRDELTEFEVDCYREGFVSVMDEMLERTEEVGWEQARRELLDKPTPPKDRRLRMPGDPGRTKDEERAAFERAAEAGNDSTE